MENTGKVITDEEMVKANQISDEKLKEIASKVTAPIYLKSPLTYRKGEVVITELTLAEQMQLIFKFLTELTAQVSMMTLTINDLLLLKNEEMKKAGFDTDKIVNNSIVVCDTKKKE